MGSNNMIEECQMQTKLYSKNHASGLNGISFCPFHRVCTGHNQKSNPNEAFYERLQRRIRLKFNQPYLFIENPFVIQILRKNRSIYNQRKKVSSGENYFKNLGMEQFADFQEEYDDEVDEPRSIK